MRRLPEQRLWDWLRTRMGLLWFAHRVENRAGTGTPDLYLCSHGMAGWAELKVLPKWAGRIRHWTPEQQVFVRAHQRQAGITWLIVQIEHELLIANGAWAVELFDGCTEAEIRHACHTIDMRKARGHDVLVALRSCVL